MANLFPAQLKVSPAFSEPDVILTYAQASGAFDLLEGGEPRVKLGNDDLYVYINSLDLRTTAKASNSSGNLLPSASLIGGYYSTPTYLLRNRANWDHHDTAAAANYGVSLVTAQDLAQEQGIVQAMRSALLYGFNATNGEGLLNTEGANTAILPPDVNGKSDILQYDPDGLLVFILDQVAQLKTAAYQLGIPSRVQILFPQRIGAQFEYAKIVEVTSYQRAGAGTSTVIDALKRVANDAGDTIEWGYDDTLIGKGDGGTDAIIITIPKIEAPRVPGLNTNVFGAELNPKIDAVNLQYADMVKPRKIQTPIPDGGITQVQELRITAGWNIRPQALTIISAEYSSDY